MNIARTTLSQRLSATVAAAVLTAAMLASIDPLAQPGVRVAAQATDQGTPTTALHLVGAPRFASEGAAISRQSVCRVKTFLRDIGRRDTGERQPMPCCRRCPL